jgi:hypothetical protein
MDGRGRAHGERTGSRAIAGPADGIWPPSRHSDEVLAAFLALSGRQQVTAGAKLFNVRNRIAAMLDEIDLLLNGGKS